MYCITRNDMKFGDLFIPARTRATVIYEPSYKGADVPGLNLYLAITLSDIALKQKESVPISEVEIQNEIREGSLYDRTKLIGITIDTDGTKVFMDAGDSFYDDATLYGFQVKKVLGIDIIPKEIGKAPYQDKYLLSSLIDYLESMFSEWVKNNCEFYTYTEEDIENGDCYSDAEPGDTTLSDKGLEQFKNKKSEYQEKLERIGFTYDFKGGLIWE